MNNSLAELRSGECMYACRWACMLSVLAKEMTERGIIFHPAPFRPHILELIHFSAFANCMSNANHRALNLKDYERCKREAACARAQGKNHASDFTTEGNI